MTTKDEALKALDTALWRARAAATPTSILHIQVGHAIDALGQLKTALAQPDQDIKNLFQSACSKTAADIKANGFFNDTLAQPEQEPIAFIDMREWPPIRWRDGMVRADVAPFDGQGLFFSPPQRKPLTDEQIEELRAKNPFEDEFLEFARAIEAAHGIKGEA